MAETFSADGKLLKSETSIIQTVRYDYETLLFQKQEHLAAIDRIDVLIAEAKKLGLDQ